MLLVLRVKVHLYHNTINFTQSSRFLALFSFNIGALNIPKLGKVLLYEGGGGGGGGGKRKRRGEKKKKEGEEKKEGKEEEKREGGREEREI